MAEAAEVDKTARRERGAELKSALASLLFLALVTCHSTLLFGHRFSHVPGRKVQVTSAWTNSPFTLARQASYWRGDCISLTWTPPAGTQGKPAYSYNVYRGTRPGNETGPLNASPMDAGCTSQTNCTYVDYGSQAGAEYYYTVTRAGADPVLWGLRCPKGTGSSGHLNSPDQCEALNRHGVSTVETPRYLFRPDCSKHLHGAPGKVDAHGDVIFDGHGKQRGRIDLEVGQLCGNCSGDPRLAVLNHALERDLLILAGLAGELDFQVEIDSRGCDGGFGQAGAHGHQGILRSARHLQHVKIAITVAGIEGLNGRRDQEITLPVVTKALAFGCVADAVELVQRMRHVIGERALLEHPLAVRGGKGGQRQQAETYQQSPEHDPSLEFKRNGHDRRSKCPRRDDGHRTVQRRNAMHSFASALLGERDLAQNGGEDHAGSVNPCHRFV